MSDTQEKLEEKRQPLCEAEHTPFKMIGKSNGTSQYYECMHCGYIDFSEAINSAKREAVLTELKWAKGASVWNIESRIALLEQSEESV